MQSELSQSIRQKQKHDSQIQAENRDCQYIFHLGVLLSGTVTTVRLHKEGSSFQIWVTCLHVTAITIPKAENILSSKCILALPGKKTSSVAVQKGCPLSPEIADKMVECL